MNDILSALLIGSITIVSLNACSSSTDDASVPLGGSCQSVSDCDDNDGTELRWCCPYANDGHANVCRSTNCYGIK